MNDGSDIAKKLAEQFGGSLIESLTPKPKPKPPSEARPTVYRAPPPPPRRTSFGTGMGDTVKVGSYELRRKPLWPNDIASLDDIKKAMPQREAQELTESDWEALAETPVKRGMDFDAWVRECCLQPLVQGYDGDYAAAARLFLQKKREAHSSK